MEGAEDITLAAAAVVNLLLRSLGRTRHRIHQALAGKRLGRFGPHLIQTDHDAARWGIGVKALNRPLLAAKSGSTH